MASSYEVGIREAAVGRAARERKTAE